MMPKYSAWIKQRLQREDPLGRCHSFCLDMQKDFPELELQAGTVLLSNGLIREHWWLKATDGSTIDPTAAQFNTTYFGYTQILGYRFLPEGQRPTGKCYNCGEYCYGGRTDFCCDFCQEAYFGYITAELRL